jgi:hypothetical protein
VRRVPTDTALLGEGRETTFLRRERLRPARTGRGSTPERRGRTRNVGADRCATVAMRAAGIIESYESVMKIHLTL